MKKNKFSIKTYFEKRCVTLFYQNGTNEKTKSAFTAVLITMAVLFFFIYMVVWRSEAGGLNEIQAAEDDVLYYNMNLDINMRNVATAVIILRSFRFRVSPEIQAPELQV